jgi:hypothetical protein
MRPNCYSMGGTALVQVESEIVINPRVEGVLDFVADERGANTYDVQP